MGRHQIHRLQGGRHHRKTTNRNTGAATAALFTKSLSAKAKGAAAEKPRSQVSAGAQASVSFGSELRKGAGGSKFFPATVMPGTTLLSLVGNGGSDSVDQSYPWKTIQASDVPKTCGETKDNIAIKNACDDGEKKKISAPVAEEIYLKNILAYKEKYPSSWQVRNDYFYEARNSGADQKFLKRAEKRAEWEKEVNSKATLVQKDIVDGVFAGALIGCLLDLAAIGLSGGVAAAGGPLLAVPPIVGGVLGVGLGIGVNHKHRIAWQSEEGIKQESKEHMDAIPRVIDQETADKINAEYHRLYVESNSIY